MKSLLDNIRGRTRSPPASNAGPRRTTAFQEAELQAAMAASLGGHHVPPASGGEAAVAAHAVDDEAAIAAAIGASLDLQEASAGNGSGSRDHVGGTDGAIPGPGPFEFTGTNEAQDLAFLTDAPLLPPAYVPASGGRGGGSGGGSGGGGGGGSGSVLEASRRGRGILGRAGGSVSLRRARARPDGDDEALARRLQEQWLSEDSAGRGAQWPDGAITHVPVRHPSMPPVRICAGCTLPITDAVFREGALGSFHVRCSPVEPPPLPPCRVCHERLPAQDGRVHFYRHNFFQDVYCPWHHGSSPRCCSCMRLEPMPVPGGAGEGPFAELSDGRMLCMACAETAVVDSSEGAPAYQDVCRFFEQELNLHVPREMREVPVLVVDSPTLNEQTHLDLKHGGGVEQGMPTTRGLTLSEVATVMHMAPGAMHFNSESRRFELGQRTPVNLGEQRVVTAILVLCGLPYASFSSVLAHEATHAWMKLDPSFPSHLPAQVEEGVCQLVALLWLQHLAGRGSGNEGGGTRRRVPGVPPSNEEFREFFVHQIKTDVSTVYGDGFRKAKAVYDAVGLDMLLDHVKRYESFPAV